MTTPFYVRHRGTFTLMVGRQTPTQKMKWHTETLRGKSLRGEEVEAEALALLADPRDSIDAVYVYSDREQRHVMTYRRPA